MSDTLTHKPATTPKDFGRGDLMAIAAVRYCLGRMTYITSDCSDWLTQQWPNITPNARNVIQRDIEEAFERDDAAREAGDTYKPLGWDCDRASWEKVRKLWAPIGERGKT